MRTYAVLQVERPAALAAAVPARVADHLRGREVVEADVARQRGALCKAAGHTEGKCVHIIAKSYTHARMPAGRYRTHEE